MRTTIELSSEHASKLRELATQLGEEGLNQQIQEAVSFYLGHLAKVAKRRREALAVGGSLSSQEAQELREATGALRENWR